MHELNILQFLITSFQVYIGIDNRLFRVLFLMRSFLYIPGRKRDEVYKVLNIQSNERKGLPKAVEDSFLFSITN